MSVWRQEGTISYHLDYDLVEFFPTRITPTHMTSHTYVIWKGQKTEHNLSEENNEAQAHKVIRYVLRLSVSSLEVQTKPCAGRVKMENASRPFSLWCRWFPNKRKIIIVKTMKPEKRKGTNFPSFSKECYTLTIIMVEY